MVGQCYYPWRKLGRLYSCRGRYECRLEGSQEDGANVRRAEAEISLEMALCGHYQGKLYHREINHIEFLPPPVSERRMQELGGLLLVEGGNVGSHGSASPSQPTVVAISPVHSPVAVPSGFPAGAQVERSNAPTRKKRSMRVVPSSEEEIESDDAGLCPRKARRIVSMARLLGCIGDILSGQFYVPKQREVVVVPSSPGASLSRSVGSPLAYALGWAITRDSLLSEDTTAQEWSRCAHPPATMSSLVGQSSDHMADDLCYATTQTSSLMVATVDQVRLADVGQGKLKVVQGALAGMRKEVRDS
ncbi:unnamed protein product [Lactuca saligna]|uniref:Uncharacterized protein n=1 Tax=Lactuca saligna TaxID=75948 RepID=A0AA35YWB7_LACSI|nr:unnamed protein product [Lactuca saligna]